MGKKAIRFVLNVLPYRMTLRNADIDYELVLFK